jgi:prepilin-type N-terminal cleavage/methylation domain-containing protein
MILKQKGFTLVELMISLLLSSILIAAIGSVFINSHNSFRKQAALSYLVQDGRVAVELLVKEFRRIGFLRNAYFGRPDDVFTEDTDVLGSGLDLAVGEYIKGE